MNHALCSFLDHPTQLPASIHMHAKRSDWCTHVSIGLSQYFVFVQSSSPCVGKRAADKLDSVLTTEQSGARHADTRLVMTVHLVPQLIELAGFEILAQKQILLTAQRASEFYAEHQGKPFFGRLRDFMTSGPIWAMVLARPNAVAAWRDMMGPTNSEVARQEKPRSLRALYGSGEHSCTACLAQYIPHPLSLHLP